MPLKFYLMVLVLAVAAAAATIGVAALLLPQSVWAGPAAMAVLAGLALLAHRWTNRR